jgi:O-antigen/teichoic acid export membrane protein
MLRNILSNWFAQVTLGLITFFLTPFMIRHLGDFQFGLYSLAFSLIGYSSLLELGIRSTLQRFVGRFKGLSDQESVNRTFTTALVLTITVGAVASALCITAAFLLPGFFKLHGEQRHLFTWLMILLGLNIAFLLPSLLLATYLSGLQRFDLYQLTVILKEVLRAFLIVLVLLLGWDVVAIGVVILLSTLAAIPFTWWLLRRTDPRVRVSLRLASWKHARELLGFSFWMFANNCGEFLRDGTYPIVIARVLGTSLITPFIVASRLVQYFRPPIVGMVGPLLPRMSGLHGQLRHQEIRDLFLRSTKLTALLTLMIGSLLVLDGRVILRLWVGQRFVSSYSLLVILTVGALCALAQLASPQLLIAMGRHRAFGIWTLGEGLANLALSIYWARRFGLAGVALGTMVPLLAVKLTLQPWYTLRVAGISWRDYMAKAMGAPLLTCALFLGIGWLCNAAFPGQSLVFLIGTVAWQIPVFAALAYWIGLTAADRDLVRSRAIQIFPQRLALGLRVGRVNSSC